ncbi:MAG: hypothetical protein V4563_16545 [Pseudomonadota bacterium]
MGLDLLFWMLMIIWLIFGGLAWYEPAAPHWRGGYNLLNFVLFAILGWKVFGAAIR